MLHIPVLKKEVIEYLNVKENLNYIDATVGEGGHAIEILKRNAPEGKLLGIDWDPEILKEAEKNLKEFKKRIILVNENFKNIKKVVKEKKFKKIKGILFDLGISSWHIEKSKRGFSFRKDEPLDLRYSTHEYFPAREIINLYPEEAIERILKEFGEEEEAKRIARAIVKARQKEPILSAKKLGEIVKKAKIKKEKIHPATKTFLALRLFLNEEIENLKEGLKSAFDVLEKGGRLVVISFHSLEDREVKNFFREKEKAGEAKVLTKKPVVSSFEEILKNPRSRSARLRALKKL